MYETTNTRTGQKRTFKSAKSAHRFVEKAAQVYGASIWTYPTFIA